MPTTALLTGAFQRLGHPDLPVYVCHIKPRFRDRIKEEIGQLGVERVTVLEQDHGIIV
jgi:hypothetical protein